MAGKTSVLSGTVFLLFCIPLLVGGCTPPDEPKESLPAGEEVEPVSAPEAEKEAPAEKVEEVEKAPPQKAGPKVHIREGADRIDPDHDMICILPASIYGFGSYDVDEIKILLMLTGGTLKAVGSRGLTLQPLKPVLEAAGLGGMSRRLGYGAYHSVDVHKSFDLSADSCEPGVAEVPKQLKMASRLAEVKLGLDFTPRYIFAMYLWAYGSGEKPGTAKCRFIGAVYDMQEDRLHSCTFHTMVFEKGDRESLATVIRMTGEIGEALFEK